ncbi:MAG: PQQ-binding-like beta-propeller repeat protein [Candidatus Bathyarchaeota archaeon]|nr:PQQ-binding-like beta-propeller repeat protein [Candidatus Bathyarchaeota archaeon]
MNKIKKTIAILIMMVLTLTTAIPLLSIPLSHAATVNFYSYIYVATSAGPRGVGVGEKMLLVAWTADMPPDTGEILGVVASPTGRAGWYGMQIKVWDPDNETTTLDMPYSDPVGANYISYTPTKVGTYRVQAIFPYTDKELKTTLVSGGSVYTAGDHYIYSAAVSPIETFEVHSEPTQQWIESPLPTGYWTRPISGASRTWYTLAGNWLGGAANVWPMGSSGGNVGTYAWGSAPESAHILWSKPFFLGGITDERFGDSAGHTAHYQGVEFSPTIILDGKIHWSPRYTTHGNKGYEIIDLYTGETLYLDWNATRPAFGTIYKYESPNQHGTFSYLWDTGQTVSFFGVTGTPIKLPEVVTVSRVVQTANLSVIKVGNPYKLNRTTTPLTTGTIWKMIDAHTGNTICYIANVSTSGTQVYGTDGSILYYNLVNKGTTTNPRYYCTVWNSSAGTMVASQSGTGYWQWRPAGGDFGAENPYFGTGDFMNPMSMDWDIVHNGEVFYSQNFSIPNIIGPFNSILNETGTIRAIRQDDIMIVGTQGRNDKRGVVQGWMIGISLKPENKGAQLWKTTFTPPFVDIDKNITTASMFTGGFTLNGVYPEDGIMVFSEVKQLKVWVYDLYTGQPLWETKPGELPQYNFYGQSVLVMDHKVIIYGGYAGQMNAYDAKTGEKVWTYNALGIGDESPYGNYPITVSAISDDKIYTTSWEHSYTIPLIRGPNLRCINVTTGEEIWSILDFGGGVAVGDGRLVSSNSMDNMIYCYGKGLSGTTVSAPQTLTTLGSSVMITGTVTDQTPTGRRTTNDKIDFTLKGTPAISDEDMGRWMEYLFMQQAYPADAKGVPVDLYAIDPNGNYIPIGTTTSDIHGNFGIMFTPEVPGTYQIHASFAGSKSYGSSSATTYMAVGEAPADAPTSTPQPASVADIYFVPAIVGLFVFMAVIGAIIILMLRKRP